MYFALSWHVRSFLDLPGYTVNPLHVPVFSGFSPLFSALHVPLRISAIGPNHLTIVPVDGPAFSCHFRSFLLRPSHFTLALFHVPVISGLSDFFRFGRLTINKSLSCPCHFRTFPTFSEHPSHNCSLSRSCHFRIFQILS